MPIVATEYVFSEQYYIGLDIDSLGDIFLDRYLHINLFSFR